MKKYPVLILAAFTVMLTACSSTATTKETQKELIQQNQIFLTPPGMAVAITREDCTTVEVTAGTQVMWINADTGTLTITIEHLDATGAVTDTENYELQPTAFMTKVFNEPATYRYTCSEDMDWYSTITVKE
jgi:plastocyanin